MLFTVRYTFAKREFGELTPTEVERVSEKMNRRDAEKMLAALRQRQDVRYPRIVAEKEEVKG